MTHFGVTRAPRNIVQDRLVAEQSRASQRLVKNNPRPLDAAAMKPIVKAAFDGDLAAVI